jgi:hypothetical protein
MIVLIYQLGDEQRALEPPVNMAVAGALFDLNNTSYTKHG